MISYSVRQKFSSVITLLALLVSLAPPFPAMAQARSEPLPVSQQSQPQLPPLGKLDDNFGPPAGAWSEAGIPAGPQGSPAVPVDLAAAAGLFLTHPAIPATAPVRPIQLKVESPAWGQDYNFPRPSQAIASRLAAPAIPALLPWPELAKLDLAAIQATPPTTVSLESLPEISGPVTTTDPEGYFSFGNLPKGTHKVTLDPASLPLELRPLENEAMPVLWLNPGQEKTSAVLASGVRFTARYDRASGNLSGLVFVDQNGDGQFGADEAGLPQVRVIDPSVHQYFVPFDDRNLSALFMAKNGGSCHSSVTAVSPNILSSIFLTSGLNGTIIYYDHWEDGYDLDPLTPGPTTEVYVRNAGETVVFNDLINPLQVGTVPPPPGRPYYDGRDRITIFGEYASVVRFAYPESVIVGSTTFPGVLAGAAWEIAEVADWGTEYSTIIGEDLDFNGLAVDDHDFTGLSVMAAQDNTTVFYNGAEVATLNAGQVYFIVGANDGPGGGGVDSTDIITATAPVQVQLLSGTCSNQGWSSNGYSLNNRSDLHNAYWAPVPGFAPTCNTDPYNVDTDIYLNNPNDADLDVTVVSGANTATVTIPPRTTISVLSATGWADLADGNAGTRLSAAAPFAGLSVINSTTRNPATTGTTSDWGYTLIPEAELSSQVIVGYAPGVDPTTTLPQDNSNLAFVTAVTDTVIFVDLENDGVPDNFDMNGDGDALDPAPLWGQPDWDETTSSNGVRVNAGQVLRVGDPTDLNLIGARIYTRDNAERIAVAWGQDPCRARRAAPSLDLGYTILPAPLLIPALAITKTRITLSPAPVGATVLYRIELQNVGQTRLDTVPLTDTYDTTYLAFTGATPATDDNNNDGVLNWANLGPLAISQTTAVTVSFTAITSTRVLSGQVTPDTASASAIDENGVGVPEVSDDAEVRIVVPDFTITKTLTTPSPVPVGEAIRYEIVIENTGETDLLTVPLTDTYETDYVTYFNASPPSLDNDNDGVINWANVGPISVGGRVTVTLNFTAAASTQDILPDPVTPDTATASAVDEFGTPVPERSDEAEVEITEADLAITKVRLTPSPVAVGDPVQFQIVVVNTGNTNLVTVPLTDTYDTTYLTYNGANPASDDNTNDGQINWTQIGPINVGDQVTITVDFIAAASTQGLPGNVTPNTATTSAVDEFGTPVRERQATDVVAIDVPALDFDKRVSPEEGSMVEPGQTLQYTLCYSNTGNRLATGVVITDSIPFNTTYAPGSAAAGAGSIPVEYSVDNGLTWLPGEPTPATDVTDLRWLIGDLPGNSGQQCVSFAVTINTTLVAPAGLTVQYSPDGWIVVEGATSDLEIIGYTTPPVAATPTITPTPEITPTPGEVTATPEATETPAEPATATPTVEATETPTPAEPATPAPEATAEDTATETSTPEVAPTDSATSEPTATETVAPEATPTAEPTSEATPAEEAAHWPQLTVIRAGASNLPTYGVQAAVFQTQISPTETTEPEPADPPEPEVSPTPTAEATATEPVETPPAEVEALTGYPIIPLERVELTIINSATIDSNETPPITDTVSNPILRIIDPRLTKVGDPDRARPGDRVEYRIEVWNPAPPANANATNVIVVDALPPQLTLIGYTITAPPGVTVIGSRVDGLVPIVGHPRGITQSLASTITLEIPALPPLPESQRVRLFVTTQVNNVADPPPVDIINQATLSFTEGSERVGSDSVNVPPVRPPRRDRDDDDDDDEVAAPPAVPTAAPPAAAELTLPVTFLPETGLLAATGPLNGWTTGIAVIGLGVLGSFGAVGFYLWRKRRQDDK